MAEVLLFHHAHGLTAGVRDFADRLTRAGHTVHTPDLYEGNVFETLPEGLDYASKAGFEQITERGRRAADGLPSGLVYAGFSLGVMPAQLLAQTRPGATGALFLNGCMPFTEYGEAWPAGVPVQVHGMDADPFFVEDGGDLDAARALVAAAPDEAELFLYPGDQHLFADDSLPSYDKDAAALLFDRTVAFLGRI